MNRSDWQQKLFSIWKEKSEKKKKEYIEKLKEEILPIEDCNNDELI